MLHFSSNNLLFILGRAFWEDFVKQPCFAIFIFFVVRQVHLKQKRRTHKFSCSLHVMLCHFHSLVLSFYILKLCKREDTKLGLEAIKPNFSIMLKLAVSRKGPFVKLCSIMLHGHVHAEMDTTRRNLTISENTNDTRVGHDTTS